MMSVSIKSTGAKPINPQVIDQVRDASRTLVREFGFLRRNLASTSLPASAVHALLEIDLRGPQTAAELCIKLNLEKSSISRMLRKLIDAGEIQETALEQDGRSKVLSLTNQGKATVNVAHQFAQQQVGGALSSLSAGDVANVVSGLSAYASALEKQRTGSTSNLSASLSVSVHMVTGYHPGAIGTIAALFSQYFVRDYGFDQYFEQKVATGLVDFTQRLESDDLELWLVMEGEQILGSLAIDGEDLPEEGVAHLRWFIMESRLAGQGWGRRLLEAAIEFCESRGFREIHLWTVKGLDASTHLYDRYDFVIDEEFVDDQWGKQAIEQKRVKRLS